MSARPDPLGPSSGALYARMNSKEPPIEPPVSTSEEPASNIKALTRNPEEHVENLGASVCNPEAPVRNHEVGISEVSVKNLELLDCNPESPVGYQEAPISCHRLVLASASSFLRHKPKIWFCLMFSYVHILTSILHGVCKVLET